MNPLLIDVQIPKEGYVECARTGCNTKIFTEDIASKKTELVLFDTMKGVLFCVECSTFLRLEWDMSKDEPLPDDYIKPNVTWLDLKIAEGQNIPTHVTGPAECDACKYEWTATAPLNPVTLDVPDYLECPNCGGMFGDFIEPDEEDSP